MNVSFVFWQYDEEGEEEVSVTMMKSRVIHKESNFQ